MFLLQMSGFPASGKSTLAKEVMKHTHAVVIDRDIIKTRLLAAKSDNINELSYQLTYDLAEFYLSLGKSVIIDTPCFDQRIIDNGLRMSQDHQAAYKYIQCTVNGFETIIERIKTRENMPSQIGLPTRENYEHALKHVVRPETYLKVNTEAYDFDKVLNYLGD